MALVIPDAMRKAFLNEIKVHRLENADNPVLCGLYVNDLDPTVESVSADLFQPGYSNYAPQKPFGWSLEYINLEGNAEIDAAPLVWEVADAALIAFDVYGYFLYDVYQNLVWAERFEDGPINVQIVGQNISLLLSLTFGACPLVMMAEVSTTKAKKPKVPKGVPQKTQGTPWARKPRKG